MAFQGDSIYWVEVEKIVPNPFQPRREFDEQKLRELADSVRMYGILQPLTVTRNEIQREDGTFYTEYELIAGERRLRASKLAGLSQVPVIIREGDDSEQEKLELAIIENLQREDLNAIDRALAFRQLADVFGLSHSQVAKKVGRSREYVSNSIRLLGLPDHMQSSLRQGEMSEGHARTLLMLNDRPEEQDVVFREILLKKLSVREVERIVRKIATDKVRKKDPSEFDTELIEMEKRFMDTLGTRVQIQKTDYGGKLTIDYFSVEDLESMLSRMKVDSIQNTAEREVEMNMLVANTPLRRSEEIEVPVAPSVALAAAILQAEADPEPVIKEEESIALENPDPLPYVELTQVEPTMNIPDEELIEAAGIAPAPEIGIDTGEAPSNQAVFRALASEANEMVHEIDQTPLSVFETTAMHDEVTLPDAEHNPEIIATLQSVVEAETEKGAEQAEDEVLAATPSNTPEDDDSNLYAIRHFSV